jgi:hypothetical protein
MKLHKIMLRHCGPKSQVEVVLLYVLADSEECILNRLDSIDGAGDRFTYGLWAERSAEAEDPFEIYDDESNVIGTETYLERMLRLRGEFNDPDADFDDAYYGIKHYGWDEGAEISQQEWEILLKLGIAQDWREPAIKNT